MDHLPIHPHRQVLEYIQWQTADEFKSWALGSATRKR